MPIRSRTVLGLSAITLASGTALGGGSDLPDGSVVITQAQIVAGFIDSGDTCDNTDAFDVGPLSMPPTNCGASTAPDEWYRLVITSTITIDIDLCTPGPTSYDSKIFVLDDAGMPVTCNDEMACSTGPGPSKITFLTLTPGNYDVAIDGFGSECGAFTVEFREFVGVSCFIELPSPQLCRFEGEPCIEGLPDNFNAGCNSTPEAFSEGLLRTVCYCEMSRHCGTTWAANGMRDTDWWSFSNSVLQSVEMDLHAEVDTVAFLVQMSPGGTCPVVGIPSELPGGNPTAFSGACDSENILGGPWVLDPGDYVVFIGAGTASGGGIFDGFPCPDGTTTNNAYTFSVGPVFIPLPPCPWDTNCNHTVDFADILDVLANWGPCPESGHDAVAVPERRSRTLDADRFATGGARCAEPARFISVRAPETSSATAAAAQRTVLRPDGFGSDIGPNPCFLDPPCSGIDEGEPCNSTVPDITNGGCSSTLIVFSETAIDGPPACGTNWAENGSRDTDWWRFDNTVEQYVEIEVRAGTDTSVILARLTDGGFCPITAIVQADSIGNQVAFSGDCDAEHVVGGPYLVDPGDYIMFVATGTASGADVVDGFPCPNGTSTDNAYELELRTAAPPPPPCVSDFNDDQTVDFADVLILIGNWGICPGAEFCVQGVHEFLRCKRIAARTATVTERLAGERVRGG